MKYSEFNKLVDEIIASQQQNYSTKEAIELIHSDINGEGLKHIKVQTEEICIEAVKFNPNNLRFVRKQTPAICAEAVRKNGWTLPWVEKQTYELARLAVEENAWAIFCVEDQTQDLCELAIEKEPLAIACIRNQTRELCMKAILKNVNALMNIEEPTEEMLIAVAKVNGRRFVLNVNTARKKGNLRFESQAAYLEAVKQNGLAIEYVPNPTEEMCIEAIKNDWSSRRYIDPAWFEEG